MVLAFVSLMYFRQVTSRKVALLVTNILCAKTDYLINNDVNSTSSKNKKAKELGIPIITEEEFLKMLEG